jgi:hypothetical protein
MPELTLSPQSWNYDFGYKTLRLRCVAGPVRQSARARKPVNYSMDPVRDGAATDQEEDGEEGEVKKTRGRRRKNKKKAGSDEDR